MISSLELARLCNVSQGTVDRALHNRPGISAKTRERVLAVAQKHGYRPHPTARELLTGERRSVGALVPSMSVPFYMDLLTTISGQLRAGGYRFSIAPVADADDLIAALDDLAAARTRLAMIIPPGDGAAVLPERFSGGEMSVVSLVNPVAGRRVRALVPDEAAIGAAATRHLIDLGHRRIVHLTFRQPNWAGRERIAGYEREMRRARSEARVVEISPADDVPAIVRSTQATALFCHNDWLALCAIRQLGAAGMRVPDDVSVIGVDDSPTFVKLYPEISTVRYPSDAIADAVMRLLAGEPGEIVARPVVAPRASTARIEG